MALLSSTHRFHPVKFRVGLSSLLFHVGQAAIKLPSAEASKRAQCTSPGYTLPKGNNENSLELNTN